MGYASHLNPVVPQSEPLRGQVANSGGGFSFPVDDWARLERFLILGSEGGSYYATERDLTVENAKAVTRCLAVDGLRTVAKIVEVSKSGRAVKNDPALVALALALKKGDVGTRKLAMLSVPEVARIGTHLFHLAQYVNALGGWGRLTRTAFARWYSEMPADKLALQAIKYQQRDGWSHRDLLRLSHPAPRFGAEGNIRNEVINWMAHGWPNVGEEPHPNATLAKIWAFERAKTAKGADLIDLIEEYDLPHECVPNDSKKDPDVWAAMLPSMGVTALVRNLGKLTSVGLLGPLSSETKFVTKQLTDVELIRRGRLHPLQILVAQRTYAQGHGDKGSLVWSPSSRIVDALDEAFYLAFKACVPTGKRHLLALDVSGSMGFNNIAGMPITPREASAAMALVTANVEEEHHFFGFAHSFQPLDISRKQRLTDATKAISDIPFGATDCSLPMQYALLNKIPVDVFVVYTDNETNHGSIHPTVALKLYRQKMGIPAKLVVVGMESNGFTIADPEDAGQLDVVGFDTSTPSVLADFVRA